MKDNESFWSRFKKNLEPFWNNLKEFLIKTKRKLKKTYRKYKYMDKTKARFFMVTTVISLFCLFVGGTYAYFNISEYLDSSIITIARLKYQLTSTNTNFKNNSITVGAGETLELTLDLKSLNPEHTKYALNYSSDSGDVKVYYDGIREQNVLGEIGGLNSIINIKMVIENNSSSSQTVNFELKGGYLQNTLACNIDELYNPTVELLFNPNGGIVTVSNKTIELTETTYGELPIPTYSGNTFLGWYTDVTNGTQIAENNEVTLKGRNTLYAHWKKNTASENTLENMNLIPTTSIRNIEGVPHFNRTAPRVLTYSDDNFTGTTSSRTMSETYQAYYYTYADSYTFNSNTGYYTLTNPQVCKYSECYEMLKGKYIVSYSGSTSSSIASSSNHSTIYKVVYTTTLTSLKYITSSKSNATYDYSEDGIFSMEDDYGTSYYFRGDIKNNYVKFGDFYWRIIRINGDGSVRMIYDGTSAHANGESSTDRRVFTAAWNTTNYKDAKYVGYMYGGSNGTASEKRIELGSVGYADSLNAIYNETDSNMKVKLEEWYVTNIKNKGLDDYVEDQIFCNDRSFSSNNTGLGYGTSTTYYGAYERLGKPILTCPNKNDAFTLAESEKGNGKLNEKIGLITRDEANMAGGYSQENRNYYLYKGYWYWSGSPCSYNGRAYVCDFSDDGNVRYFMDVNNTGGVAPVISLSAEYFSTLVGDGTVGNEYRSEA